MFKIDRAIHKPDHSYLQNAVKEMMRRGVKVSDLRQALKLFENEQGVYQRMLEEDCNITNPNSSKQVIEFIKSIGDPAVVDICYQDSKWTSKKDALVAVAGLGYDFAAVLIQYRTAKKYADSIKKLIEYRDKDGLIHPMVSVTKTNRISYSNPALMNIPKPLLWNLVVPMKPGDHLFSVDIKNQEPSILINGLNIEELKPAIRSPKGLYEELYNQIPVTCKVNFIITTSGGRGIIDNSTLERNEKIPSIYYSPKRPEVPVAHVIMGDGSLSPAIKLIDIINVEVPAGTEPEIPRTVNVEDREGNIHTVPIKVDTTALKTSKAKAILSSTSGIIETTARLEGITLLCEGAIRSEFKKVWNAMTYGASSFGVKKMCHLVDGDIYFRFISKIDEMARYRTICKKLANDKVVTSKTFFNTPINLGYEDMDRLNRIHMDVPIQGTAADILALLVQHFNEETKARGIDGDMFIYYPRHDELIIEVSDDLMNRMDIVGELRDLLEHQVDNWVPFKVEISELHPTDIHTLLTIETDDEDEG